MIMIWFLSRAAIMGCNAVCAGLFEKFLSVVGINDGSQWQHGYFVTAIIWQAKILAEAAKNFHFIIKTKQARSHLHVNICCYNYNNNYYYFYYYYLTLAALRNSVLPVHISKFFKVNPTSVRMQIQARRGGCHGTRSAKPFRIHFVSICHPSPC